MSLNVNAKPFVSQLYLAECNFFNELEKKFVKNNKFLFEDKDENDDDIIRLENNNALKKIGKKFGIKIKDDLFDGEVIDITDYNILQNGIKFILSCK